MGWIGVVSNSEVLVGLEILQGFSHTLDAETGRRIRGSPDMGDLILDDLGAILPGTAPQRLATLIFQRST